MISLHSKKRQSTHKSHVCFGRLSDLTIALKEGKSFVWKSFGFLRDKAGKRLHDDQIFCTHCFESEKLKSYKESVSTTNLAQHLREAHGILYYSYKPLRKTILALGLVFVHGYRLTHSLFLLNVFNVLYSWNRHF